MRKSSKYLVIFDCNLTSLFLLNHIPFNESSIFLRKINRNSLFNNKVIKWIYPLDKSRFRQINYKDNFNQKLQKLI